MEEEVLQLDEEAGRFATELARLTGDSIEDVVLRALRERLKQLDPSDPLVCDDNGLPK